MLIKFIGVLLILAGIAGLVLPFIPGLLLIGAGIAMLFGKKRKG